MTKSHIKTGHGFPLPEKIISAKRSRGHLPRENVNVMENPYFGYNVSWKTVTNDGHGFP